MLANDRIDEFWVNQFRNHFPSRVAITVEKFCKDFKGKWHTSRFIQISAPLDDSLVHYEYRINQNWRGQVELHFEGKDWEQRYGNLVDFLMERTEDHVSWCSWGDYGYRCILKDAIDYSGWDTFFRSLDNFISLFDELIKNASKDKTSIVSTEIPCDGRLEGQNGTVELYLKRLGEILSLPLSIPDYQRIYCWEERNVKCLLDDVFGHLENLEKNTIPYRLGAIILYSHDGIYDIIDGQQRLVTLSLLLNELGRCASLLNQKFTSTRSKEYIAYNKWIIECYVRRHSKGIKNLADALLSSIEFSVLVLQDTSLDLAYTFFSNQNSRGVALTDYDLLKAHHLRYIPTSFEQQSMRAASVWNRMIENGRKVAENSDGNEVPDYVSTLDTYIYRLRKWMRKKGVDDSQDNYRIKQEYEAAPIVEEIAPFGEKFYFNEPIQGGTHFFTYVEQHLNKFNQFKEFSEYKILHKELAGGSFQWYRDVIEALLYGYYLKFGSYYLSDALIVIMRIISQHRFDNNRAIKSSIVQYAGETELILMIDQATSPTFFLAETRNICKELSFPLSQNMRPIMRAMRQKTRNIANQLEGNIVIESFKNLNR